MAVNLGDSFEKKKTMTYVYGVQTAYGGALGGLDINIEPPFDWRFL